MFSAPYMVICSTVENWLLTYSRIHCLAIRIKNTTGQGFLPVRLHDDLMGGSRSVSSTEKCKDHIICSWGTTMNLETEMLGGRQD